MSAGYCPKCGQEPVRCWCPPADPRDAEIASLRAEVERLTRERDEAMRCNEANIREAVRLTNELAKERQTCAAFRAQAESLAEALRASSDALWRAGNMLSAICETDATRDRRKAADAALRASGDARVYLVAYDSQRGTR